jgi:hypothetical protein
MLYAAGMKTESEFVDVTLDFIRNVVFHLHFKEMMQNMKLFIVLKAFIDSSLLLINYRTA